MAKGTSNYVKPKKQVIKELDEAIGDAPAPVQKPKPKPAPKPKQEKKWWES